MKRTNRLVALAISLGVALAVLLLWPAADPPPAPQANHEAPAAPVPMLAQPQPATPSPAPPSPPAIDEPDDDNQTGTVPNGQHSFTRAFSATIHDEAGRPLSGASITSGDLPVCRSDGSGRCAFSLVATCQTCKLNFEAGAPGFADTQIRLEGEGELVVLSAGRTITATVVAPSDALLSALSLRVTVDAPPLETSVPVDHAGTYPLEALPRAPVLVALMDRDRPLKKVTVPVERDTVTFELTPRRLDVQIETDDVQGTEDCRVVDLRCEGTNRLLQRVDLIGGRVLHARFEYAPEGPCTVALSDTCDRGMSTDPRATVTGVMPPTAIVLHRRP